MLVLLLQAVTNAGTFAVQAAATIADGADVTLGAKADAKSTATDTTPISAMSVLKQISASVQAPPSQAVTNVGTFATQSAITAASGSIASGAIASGAIASGAIAAGAVAAGAFVSGSVLSGALASGAVVDLVNVTGTKAAGTAANDSLLTGGVANTSAPSPTNGQQIAIQMDTAGNVRINPYGSVGSFASVAGHGNSGGVALTVPAATKWLLKAGQIKYITSSVTLTRQVGFYFADTTGTGLQGTSATPTQGASVTAFYNMGPGIPQGATFIATQVNVPISELALGPGFTANMNTGNGVASDSWTMTLNVIVLPD